MRFTPLIGAVALIACGPRTEQLTFQARVSDLRRPSNALAKNKGPDQFVEITAPGRLFNPVVEVKPVARRDADWSTPEGATAAIVSANLAVDSSWVVENYSPEEREEARRGISDPAVAARTWNYYRNMGKIVMMGWAEVRGFRLMFLQGREEDGDATFVVVTLKKIRNGWRQSNALANTDEFEVIWTALHTGGIRSV